MYGAWGAAALICLGCLGAIEDGDLEAAEEAADGINVHASEKKDRDGDGIEESAYYETQQALNDARQ
jgi:hypothetical protein